MLPWRPVYQCICVCDLYGSCACITISVHLCSTLMYWCTCGRCTCMWFNPLMYLYVRMCSCIYVCVRCVCSHIYVCVTYVQLYLCVCMVCVQPYLCVCDICTAVCVVCVQLYLCTYSSYNWKQLYLIARIKDSKQPE